MTTEEILDQEEEMKERMSRRGFLRALGASALATWVAGCQPRTVVVEKEVEKEVTKIVEKEKVVEKEVTRVVTEIEKPDELSVYWHPAHAYEAYKAVFFEFEDEFGVEIKPQYFQWPDMRTKLLAEFAAGTAPDFIEDSGGAFSRAWADLGYPLDLGPFIERDGQEMGFPDDWQEQALKRGMRFDKHWAISLHLTCNLCFYNKAMYEAAGIGYPTTWDEFLNAAKALTKGEEVWGFYVESNPDWSWYWQNGVPSTYDPETNTVNWGSDEAIEALQFVADLIHVHKVSPLPTIEVIDTGPTKMFVAERAAMYFTGPWQVKPVRTGNPDLNWGIGQMMTKKRRATGMAGTNVMIASTTPYKDLCWELLKKLVSVDTEVKVTKEAGMPMPRISWGQHPDIQADPEMRAWAEGLTYAMMDTSMQELDQEIQVSTGDLHSTAWQKVIFGDATAKDALSEAAAEANRLLAEA